MKYILQLFIAISLPLITGCGEPPEDPPLTNNPFVERWGTWESYQADLQSLNIDEQREELLHYIQIYETMKQTPIRQGIQFVFADLMQLNQEQFEHPQRFALEEFAAGGCVLPHRTILIDYTMWKISTRLKKEILVSHELGHCDLNRREHEPDNKPSIMNEKLDLVLNYIIYGDSDPSEEIISSHIEEKHDHRFYRKLELYQELFGHIPETDVNSID